VWVEREGRFRIGEGGSRFSWRWLCMARSLKVLDRSGGRIGTRGDTFGAPRRCSATDSVRRAPACPRVGDSWLSAARPEKKREPKPTTETQMFPMQLTLGDRPVDASGEYEVIGRPPTRPPAAETHT